MTDAVHVVVQSGGKLIGQGGYGCIFSPPLICRGDTKPRSLAKSNKLGKMTELSDIKNEISASKVLGRFPDSSKYCILAELNTICKPAPMSKQKERALKNCHALDEFGSENMMQYELEYGGKTLKVRLQTTDVPLSFPFFRFMDEFLEIGAYLVLHGCIHNDLHANNIVLKDNYTPRLIDFGRSYIYTAIDKDVVQELAGVKYNASLSQIPPEITAHHGVNSGISMETIILDLYSEKTGLLYAERFLGMRRAAQLVDLKEFWDSSRAVQSEDWVSFYKLYWPVVDSWAIGYNLISILKRLLLSKQFAESKEWIQKQGVVKSVLRGLLQASPRKRIDPVEALAMYDPMNALVSSASGKAWLDKKIGSRQT